MPTRGPSEPTTTTSWRDIGPWGGHFPPQCAYYVGITKRPLWCRCIPVVFVGHVGCFLIKRGTHNEETPHLPHTNNGKAPTITTPGPAILSTKRDLDTRNQISFWTTNKAIRSERADGGGRGGGASCFSLAACWVSTMPEAIRRVCSDSAGCRVCTREQPCGLASSGE